MSVCIGFTVIELQVEVESQLESRDASHRDHHGARCGLLNGVWRMALLELGSCDTLS